MIRAHDLPCRSAWVPALTAALLLLTLPSDASAQTAEELVASGDVRIRSRVAPEGPILVGQKVTLYVDVSTSTFFPEPVAFPSTVDAPNAVVLPSTSGGSFVDRVDGQSFAGISRRYEIFPLGPGAFETPEVRVTAIVSVGGVDRSPEIELIAPPVRVDVELPPGVEGLGLVVSSPSLEVTESWEPAVDEVRVGDAVERSVTTTVSDSVAMLLPSPDLSAPAGVTPYPRQPAFDDRTNRGQRSGSRTDRVTYLFEFEGTAVWPPVEIAWWDIRTGELRRELLPEREIRVLPNPDLGADLFADPESAAAGEDVPAPSRTGIDWTRVVGLSVVALGFVVLFVRFLRRRSRRASTPEATHDRAVDEAFAAFEGATRRNDGPASYRELLRWIALAGPSHGVETLATLARNRPKLAGEVETLESRLYGAGTGNAETWEGRRLFEEVEAAWEAILASENGGLDRVGLPITLNPRG